MTDLEIAWLAGLLEGEGCFRVNDSPARKKSGRRPSLTVKLKMSDEDIVTRAADLMKAARVRAIKPSQTKANNTYHNRERWSDVYELEIGGQKAEDVMSAVLPYMGKRRSAKIRECLATPNLSHKPKEV